MDWFAKGSDVLTDPRTWEFAAALGVSVPTAAGHLDGVYGMLAKHGDERGVLGTVPDHMLEHVALWDGDAGKFASTFRRLYQDADGTLHQWKDWNGARIAGARKERRKKRLQRQKWREEQAERDTNEGDRPPGVSPGQSPGPAFPHDMTGQDTVTTTPTTLPATRKNRESRPNVLQERTTWLTPIGAAWEAVYGPGSFPYPQAAREMAPLQKAGLTPEEIARRLSFYLANKGSEVVLDPEQLKRRTFTPNLRDFRLRHGQFDPSALEAA